MKVKIVSVAFAFKFTFRDVINIVCVIKLGFEICISRFIKCSGCYEICLFEIYKDLYLLRNLHFDIYRVLYLLCIFHFEV